MPTPRENLLRALGHQVPAWVPICGHCDPYNQPNREGMAPELAQALGTVRWGDESTVTFSRYLGIEIMDWFSRPIRTVHHAVTTEQRQEGRDSVTVWHTPRGDLREVQRRGREDGPSYRIEHLLKTADDIPALASLIEDQTFEIDPERARVLTRRRELIGEDGILTLPMPGTPLGMLVRVYAGVATTAYLCADAPAGLRDLFAVMECSYLEQLRLAATCEADALVTVDDTSTTTISPAMFEAYCMGYTDAAADAAHEQGRMYFHHSCGLIRDLLGLYRQTRMDAVHALQVPPMGDVTIAEAKEKLGPRIAIIASLTPLFGLMDDWDAVTRSVREMFEGAGAGDNFVLSLAPDPTKTMAETQRLLHECRKYQRLTDPRP